MPRASLGLSTLFTFMLASGIVWAQGHGGHGQPRV